MARKRHSIEHILKVLREIEVHLASVAVFLIVLRKLLLR